MSFKTLCLRYENLVKVRPNKHKENKRLWDELVVRVGGDADRALDEVVLPLIQENAVYLKTRFDGLRDILRKALGEDVKLLPTGKLKSPPQKEKEKESEVWDSSSVPTADDVEPKQRILKK